MIDELAEGIEPEIKRNYNRWTGSYSLWKSCVQKLKILLQQDRIMLTCI